MIIMRSAAIVVCTLAVLCLAASTSKAQTGSVAGTVTDAATGEPLPGVNVVIEGTTQGTSTGLEGRYTILNVTPGTYSLRASFIGFAPKVVEDVRVNIDRTTEVDIAMEEGTVGMEEVVVTAEQPVVKRDLSASRIDVSAEDIENLPVSDVTAVVGLQAGVEGLSIRGSGADEMGFLVDGFELSGSRDNQPFTDVSYTAIQEVQIQSGGFNAEYGNIRSGLVNVVTREGPRDRYVADVILRYSPPAQKNFGGLPTDPDSYWMRPYLDDAVAWEGTADGDWDEFTRKQYPSFIGFNAISRQTMEDDNPDNDLTPEQAQELFRWRHRRSVEIDAPDYTVDGSIGGPVPLLNRSLGDLRFFASYRQTQDQYVVPFSRDGYNSSTGQLKLTSDVAPGMKLALQGLIAKQRGSARLGQFREFVSSVRQESREFDTFFYTPSAPSLDTRDVLFVPAAVSLSDVDRNLIGVEFTHSLNAKTFYEIGLNRYATQYRAYPPEARNTDPVETIGGLSVDEAPFGYYNEPANSLTGLTMGPHLSVYRDTSDITQWEFRGDLTSQVHRHHQIKVGFDVDLAQQNVSSGQIDFNTGVINEWEERPIYAAVYAQEKTEFRGMVANIGLRLDYQNPNNEWYVFEDPYNPAFLARNVGDVEEMLETEPVEPKVALSPRVGVSFPVTETNKLYFNYGHFQQTLPSENLYLQQRNLNGFLLNLSNPRAPLQKTVAYELGYEQSLFDQYLIRIAGYYKDVSDQPHWTLFVSRNSQLRYFINQPTNYEDIRGFEISVYKNAGKWIRGFVNYTYMVTSAGNFGFGAFHEDRLQQQLYEEQFKEYYQTKPVPQPYARVSLDILIPPDFGPEIAGIQPLADWRINFLGRWRAGFHFTWTAGQVVGGVQDNMQWEDFKMIDVRISKNFNVAGSDALFFLDVYNAFNLKNLNYGSFLGPEDFDNYMHSLHLPQEQADEIPGYTNEYGDDQPGDVEADYIDPPNGDAFRYLFPRDFYFGLRLTM